MQRCIRTYINSTSFRVALIIALTFIASACSSTSPAFGERGYITEGKASYYSPKLEGRSMANGEPYNAQKLTAAHKKLPFGTKVKVTNLQTNKSVKVKISDRGPFVKGRVIDLSEAAARRIGSIESGVVPVKVKVVRAVK